MKLPPQWDKFIPPPMVNTRIDKDELGNDYVHPVWNREWLEGLKEFIWMVVRDEINRNPDEG